MNKSILHTLALFTAFALFTAPLHAQIEGCDAATTPAGSGGVVSGSASTVCPPTLFAASVSGLGTPAGYFTEYVFFNPDDTTCNADSLSCGPNILAINSTGLFDAGAAGLVDGDRFGVTAVTWDVTGMQNNTQEILTGSVSIFTCCFLAQTFSGIDVCGAWNAAGVTMGSDVTSLADYLAFIQNSGGGPNANSLDAILFGIDTLNDQAGESCTSDLPICYATSAPLYVDVDCGPPACSSATPPQNLSHSLGASKITLAWDAVPGSIACQLVASRITPPGASPKKNIIGFEPSSVLVPYSLLGNGTTWSWKGRCACTIPPDPIDATAFSVSDTFTIPPLRMPMADASMDIFPNPATDEVQVRFAASSEQQARLTVTDLSGRVLVDRTLQLFEGNNALNIDVNRLEAGVYIVEIKDENSTLTRRLIVE